MKQPPAFNPYYMGNAGNLSMLYCGAGAVLYFFPLPLEGSVEWYSPQPLIHTIRGMQAIYPCFTVGQELSCISSLSPCEGCVEWYSPQPLKGVWHEIFDFRFFSWISVPQASKYSIGAILNFFEYLRKYLWINVYHRCQLFSGVNDTGEKFIAGVNNTGD